MMEELNKQPEEELKEKNIDEVETEKKEVKEEKTFTQSELDSIIQKRLDREMKKFEDERKLVEETAHMTAEEKAKAEFEAEKQAWEKEKAVFERQKLELATTKKLAEQGLPSEFALLVLGNDEEETDNNIENFKEHWKNSLEKAVNERLSGTAPKTGNSRPKANMTKEEFGKLSYKERTALLEKDPNYMGKLK